MVGSLSFITITFNNPCGLLSTFNSIAPLLNQNVEYIIINGGDPLEFDFLNSPFIKLIQEPDNGIYDAINKGLGLVSKDYFMIIHSGDKLSNVEMFQNAFSRTIKLDLDLSLNSCKVKCQTSGQIKRKHNAKYWHPFLLRFGVQPPHPPIFYKSSKFKKKRYSVDFSIIGDYVFFDSLNWKLINYSKSKDVIIEMETGGKTTSGFQNLLVISLEMIKYKGFIYGGLRGLARIPIKLFLAII